MLIIGHRGAAGLAAENTLASLRAARKSGADILEFDIRLTADHIPILAHDPFIAGKRIASTTFAQLQKITAVDTLQSVLDEFYGKILLNIELKQTHTAAYVYEIVKMYVDKERDWDAVLFSSFKPQLLRELRALNSHTNLALLQHANPFSYILWHRRLGLTAVGFHRLNANALAVTTAKELGIFTYVYTVDRPDTAKRFARRGIGGIVTNRPDLLRRSFQKKR